MTLFAGKGSKDHFPEPRFWTVKSGFAPSGALSVNAAAVITSQR